MVSLMDAMFIPVAALFTVGFLVPGIVLAPQKSADFASVTTEGTMEVVIPSMLMTYFNTRGGKGKTNYKDISYRLSGKPSNTGLRKTAIRNYPQQLSFLKLRYVDPHNSNSFSQTMVGSRKLSRQDHYYEMGVPVKGGDIGKVVVIYEVY